MSFTVLYHTKQQLGTTTSDTYNRDEINYIIPNNNWELQQFRTNLTREIYYIIPNNNWELQQFKTNSTREILLYHTKQQLGTTTACHILSISLYYIIPNNNWELQHYFIFHLEDEHYIIPNNNWELQL